MFLGIDLGTSSVKLILLNNDQEILSVNSQPLTVSQPKPLWSEQHPEQWWQAVCDGVRALQQTHAKELAALQAIGLSGQQHGATLLDKNDQALRPAMLWNDGRAYSQCITLADRVPHYQSLISNRIMPGFTAPKVLWVAEHEPEIFKKIAKILLPKDYLRLRLTGNYASDMSDAAGTAWLNIQERCWSDEMLAATHLTQTNMPTLFEGSDITGTVTKMIAESWGIPANTVVIGGGGDNPASAISINVIKPGSAFLSLGTSGVYFVASDRYQLAPENGVHSFCHCLPERWHQMSVHLSAAASLSWWMNTLKVSDAERLLQEAENNFNPDHSVVFLPYLSGERTPHNDPHAKGVFYGMTHANQRADLTRAILEGVAFAFADGQTAMLQAGIRIDEVSVIGGGAKSLFWGKILANVLQRPLIYRQNREVGGALGAARLAWLAINKTDASTAFATPPIETVAEPDKNYFAYYTDQYAIYKKLYRQLKEVFNS